MGDGLKCNHPLTWGCCVDVIYDLCVICQQVLEALIVSYGCRDGRGVMLMLFVIYAHYLLVSN